MSRYIDYDAIDYRNDKLHDKTDEFLNGVVYMAERIEEAPRIDICFCRWCMHWDDTCGWCNAFDSSRNCDDFCSSGEPKEKPKGLERLVKGSEQTDCQACKWWSSYGYCVHRECKGYEPQTERSE